MNRLTEVRTKMGDVYLRLNRGLKDALAVLGLYLLTVDCYIRHIRLLFHLLFIKDFAEQCGTDSACQLVIHFSLQ